MNAANENVSFHWRDVATMRDHATGKRYRIREYKHYWRIYEIKDDGKPLHSIYGLIFSKSAPDVPRITDLCYLADHPRKLRTKPFQNVRKLRRLRKGW